jgi:NADPH:quinone reductase-like Zn-dependent oxidoreductase
MRAIVIKQYGGPDVLAIEERPDPEPKTGHVVIEVKAFGLNHAEVYFRQGAWGDVAEISGIECVGLARSDPDGRFAPGQKVMAIVGGMGRTLNGSYAELVRVPASNVAAVTSDLPWEALAAVPESYATAWTALIGILALAPDQTVAIRGATSALGQAAVNIAAHAGARVIATTRNASSAALLEGLGADDVLPEAPDLASKLRERTPQGIDSVLDIVGNTTILDSLALLRRGGHACLVGFLGGGGPLVLEPVFQIPSGRHLSVFASALVTGTPDFPLSEIPFQTIVERVAAGVYKAKPAKVLRFDQIQAGHRLMETSGAGGKIVVTM